jgi:hypothetical protein
MWSLSSSEIFCLTGTIERSVSKAILFCTGSKKTSMTSILHNETSIVSNAHAWIVHYIMFKKTVWTCNLKRKLVLSAILDD